jgi:hypothetical protein
MMIDQKNIPNVPWNIRYISLLSGIKTCYEAITTNGGHTFPSLLRNASTLDVDGYTAIACNYALVRILILIA